MARGASADDVDCNQVTCVPFLASEASDTWTPCRFAALGSNLSSILEPYMVSTFKWLGTCSC